MNTIPLKISDPSKHVSQPREVNRNYSPEEKTKLAKASRDFESMLTSIMLKSMMQTTNGLFGENSYGGDMFDTIFFSEIAGKISEDKGLGVADVLYNKLTGESLNSLSRLTKMSPLRRSNVKLNSLVEKFPVIQPSSSSLKRLDQFEKHINDASKLYGIDTNLIRSVILTESAGKIDAISTAKAKGLMQLMDGTAKEMGVRNVWDPRENIFGGTKYLAQMLRQYNGDIKLALAAYNAGPGNVNKYNGIPPFDETRNYINRVIGYYKYLNG